jgi:hypothetical protein
VSGRPLQFSLVLPLICLVIWVTAVLVPTTVIFLQMKSRANGAGSLTIRTATIEATIPPDDFFPFALHGATIRTAKAVAGINVPGLFIEAGLSSVTSWPHRLYPSRYLLESWRALVFPIYALPAWWYAGRGIDGFVGRVRLRVVETIVSTLVSLAFIGLGVGLQFGLSQSERDADLIWFTCGLIFWGALIAIEPAGWLRQRRKALSNQPVTAG